MATVAPHASRTTARTILTRKLMAAAASRSPHRVADASHGVDELALAITLELSAEVADVHGEVLRIGTEVVAPDAVVDRAVVEHDPAVAHEQLEDVELGFRQLDLAAAAPH